MDTTPARPLLGVLIGFALMTSGCAGSAGQRAGSDAPTLVQKKTAVLAVSAPIPAFSYAYLGTSGGGAQSFIELWQQGLATSGKTDTAPMPRVATELPSLDRGTAQLLPDGRLRATWKIRPDVKWADGVDLTAADYAFGVEVGKDKEHSLAGATLVINIFPLVESLDVVDEKTFVMTWRSPYYQFDALGNYTLQPLPTHILRAVWDERNMERFANHAYWRDGYFQVGPFRPTRFEPQVEIVLEAVPHYFLGRPKLDTIVIKQFADPNVVHAAVLAKAVDLTGDNVLQAEQAMELKKTWERTGEGTVYIGYGTTRGIFPMFNPETQTEPAMLDARVRQALYRAVDRDTLATAILAGRTENSAYSILPPDHTLYEFTKDGLRSLAFDERQAARALEDLGWERGPGGLRNRVDGRPFRVEVFTTQGAENEANILADMWRQVGLDTPIRILPTAQQGDRIVRQSFPGIEITARGYGDHLLTRGECETLPRAPRFDGANRGHYCTSEADRLIADYRGSITRATQAQAIGEIARFYARELPMMPLFYNLTNPTVARGLTALEDDFSGGLQSTGYYGSYFRNAHLWEWRS